MTDKLLWHALVIVVGLFIALLTWNFVTVHDKQEAVMEKQDEIERRLFAVERDHTTSGRNNHPFLDNQ